MDAATTSLVRSVWQNYFSPEHQQQLQQQADHQQQLGAAGAAAGGVLQQQEAVQVRRQYSWYSHKRGKSIHIGQVYPLLWPHN
jgi:hypothetical protein